MMSDVKIICIIVTYNGVQWISAALESLRTSSVHVDLLVIDNASTDSTVEIILERFPDVVLIESQENMGFGKANNVGLRYALDQGAEYVFLMNQDVYVQVHTVEVLLEAAKNNPDFSVISPIHLNGKGDLLDHNFAVHITPPQVSADLVSGMFLSPNTKKVFPVDYVNAAAWFMPASTITSVGGFDPIFSHYGEDEHYLRRLAYHGGKMGVILSTCVMHDREQFGSVVKYKKGLYFRRLLMGSMDITKGKFEYFFWSLRKLVQYMGYALLNFIRMRPNRGLGLITAYFKFLFYIPLIAKSRRINKNRGPHWI